MLFPSRCGACNQLGPSPCAPCRARLRPAGPVPPVEGIDRVVALYRYVDVMRRLLGALKYRNNRACVGWLADELALTHQGYRYDGVLSWAPTSAARARRRGFDQSELLAAAVARRLDEGAGRPVALLRRLPGPAQTGAVGAVRHDQVHFGIRRPARAAPRRVVLVDDVVTTGATLSAAAATLRAHGSEVVEALVVAWTPPPG